MSFIQRVSELLIQNKISRAKMLSDLQLGKNQFSYWENKNSVPNGATLAKISEYFNVSTDYLLGKDDIKNRPASNEDVERILKDIQDDPELTEYVTKYLSLPPEGRAHMRQQLDILNRAYNSKGE